MRTLEPQNPPMRGPDVTSLQRLLNQKGFRCGVDGVYGAETQARVVDAKKALHYPKARQKPYAGDMFRNLLKLYPVPSLQLPQFFVPTHETAGLPGFHAIDLFAEPGTLVKAPETGRIVWPHFIAWSDTKRVGGWTCYIEGPQDTYFDTHFAWVNKAGPCLKGQVIGAVGKVPYGWWAPHIHHAKHSGRYEPVHGMNAET